MLSDFKLHKRAIGAYEICRVYKYNYSHSKLIGLLIFMVHRESAFGNNNIMLATNVRHH